jgi:hypothetical protein
MNLVTFYYREPTGCLRLAQRTGERGIYDLDLLNRLGQSAARHGVNPRVPLWLAEYRFQLLSYGHRADGEPPNPRQTGEWTDWTLASIVTAIRAYQQRGHPDGPLLAGLNQGLTEHCPSYHGPGRLMEVWQRYWAYDTLDELDVLVTLDGAYWQVAARETEEGIELKEGGLWTPWRQLLPSNITGRWQPLSRTLALSLD